MKTLADMFTQPDAQAQPMQQGASGAGALANDPGGVMGGLASAFLQTYQQPQQAPARPSRPEPGGAASPGGLPRLFG